MSTLATLKAEILSDTRPGDTDLATDIAAKISAAITHYNRKRFWFNVLDDVDVPLVVGTSRYDSATVAGIVRIDNVFLIKSDSAPELTRQYGATLEALLGTSPDNGEPTDFSYTNNELRLYPPPDDTYTLRVHGEANVAAPASDSEANNPWMVEGYELIRARATWLLWNGPLQAAGGEEAQGCKQRELDALRVLEDETNKRNATGVIEATEF